MSARTAIVILNWNGEKFLRQFLHTLVENTNPDLARICIIDNGSTDGSLQFLSENFSQIQLVKLDKNYGFAGGYNRGLKEIEAEYFMLLNSDVEVGKDWIAPLVELMDSDPTIGVCGPKLIDYNNRDKFEYAGAAGGYIDKYGYPFCRGRLFECLETDNGQHDTREDCLWISGAALFIRSKLFFEVGGFDDDFFAGIVEVDNECISSCFKQLRDIFEKTNLASGAFPSESVKIVEDVKVVTHVIETVVVQFVDIAQSCRSGGHEASLIVMNPAVGGGVVVFVEVPAIYFVAVGPSMP